MAVSQYVFVRAVHVLSGGFLFGGSALLYLAFHAEDAVSRSILAWFEALFWGVLGALVFTGLGNAAGFGVPPVETDRGSVLAAKFGVLAAVVVISVLRTSAVLTLGERDQSTVSGRRLRKLYVLTALGLATIVLLAGVYVRG